MHRMELRRVSTAPPITVEKRYELIYQPVAVDISINPLTEALASHDENLVTVHRWLDHHAQDVIARALASEPEVGNEVRILSIASN